MGYSGLQADTAAVLLAQDVRVSAQSASLTTMAYA